MTTNELGQPVGERLPDWRPAQRPERVPMEGRYGWLEPLDPFRHAADLHEANALDAEGRMWTYLPYGPFASFPEYSRWLESMAGAEDPCFFSVLDGASGKAVGLASFLRIDPLNGVIEVGHLAFSPLLQRKPLATEAMYLMMRAAFDWGYRRYEWKCHALNAPSRRAAERLGFQYEGLFRQAAVVKGRSRDTAWYSILDSEWPRLRARFERWLDPANMDAHGQQVRRLSECEG